ncbi:MAG: hypothetical protein REI94_10190 [Moraxellaceae bacterium]|nr:hypothetical protein [Moraxellaceae bacterium]
MDRVKVVRSSLRRPRPQKAGGSKVWAFLNSSFGLWLLTSVVLSFASWQFTQWHDDRKARTERQARIEKLDVEIASRLDRHSSSNLSIVRDPKSKTKPTTEEKAALYKEVLLPPPIEMVVYPEFAQRGLVSLLSELTPLLTDMEQQCLMRARYEALHLISDAALVERETVLDALRPIERIADHRWSFMARVYERLRKDGELDEEQDPKVEVIPTPLRCGSLDMPSKELELNTGR